MTTRPVKEIQRAHDLITAVLLREVPINLKDEVENSYHICCDVLCWVLEHDHNESFKDNLERLEAALHNKGFVLEDRGN